MPIRPRWPLVLTPTQRAVLSEIAAGCSKRSYDTGVMAELSSMELVDVQVGDVFLTDRGRMIATSLGLRAASDENQRACEERDNGIYSM